MKLHAVLTLDGVHDYLSVADNDSLRITTYTAELWIKPHGVPNEPYKGLFGKPGRNFNVWLYPSGMLDHRFHNPATSNAGPPTTPAGAVAWDRWNHIAISNDGTTVRTYVDGRVVAEGPTGGAPIADHTTLFVGRNLDGVAGNYFKGDIAEFRLWDHARSGAEIREHLDRPLSGSEPGLVVYWPLFDGTATDRSGRDNHGEIHGHPETSFTSDLPFIDSDDVRSLSCPVLSFDGVDDFLEPGAGLPDVTSAVTVEFWARGHSHLSQKTSVIEIHHPGGQRALNIHLPWGSRSYWDAGNAAGGDRIDKEVRASEYKNEWAHWAFVKDPEAGMMSIYRNGELWHSGTGMHRPVGDLARLVIGGYVDHTQPWDGLLAEVRIWNLARAQEELRRQMCRRCVGDEDGLVGYWACDEGEGDIAHDRSGNENHGAIHGATWEESELPLLPRLERRDVRGTGLEDYAFWWQWKQQLAAKDRGEPRPFRRGRIWT